MCPSNRAVKQPDSKQDKDDFCHHEGFCFYSKLQQIIMSAANVYTIARGQVFQEFRTFFPAGP
ncbi:MAG: hypothetical protein DME23_22955 [Verrucomicrobia bacterium]|nr:MAG: hypothetical protein DME23_22955 [Verrucomicrobiota bacterium]